MGVSFLWFMVLSLRTGIHPLAFLHTIPYTTGKSDDFCSGGRRYNRALFDVPAKNPRRPSALISLMPAVRVHNIGL